MERPNPTPPPRRGHGGGRGEKRCCQPPAFSPASLIPLLAPGVFLSLVSGVPSLQSVVTGKCRAAWPAPLVREEAPDRGSILVPHGVPLCASGEVRGKPGRGLRESGGERVPARDPARVMGLIGLDTR